MTAPTVTVSNPSTLSGSAVRALVAWTGTDHAGGSGILLYRLDRSVNGGAWTTVQNLSVSTSTQVLTVGAAYRFRVQAIDHDRNVSGTAYGITIKARLTQQTSSAVHFTSTWSASSSTSYSGGSVRWSKVAGASASYTATGRSYAIVATRAPRGERRGST
ncbi:MAG: fibronectin type III domain-containing protein [Candidatus Limnocylindrales bacterium]